MGDAGDGGTYTWAVFEEANVSPKIGRGVVSSLVKKGLVSVDSSEEDELFDLTDEGKRLTEGW
jgi:predicted transcriptional regulator